jgi:hypothetical protein
VCIFADETRLIIFLKSFKLGYIGPKKKKLTNNFSGLVASGLEPDATDGPPV